jgi:Zn-finger nucleic acid-binding protein
MVMVEGRGGIEIDRCPNCRGVWLDPGELDELIGADGRHDETARLRHCGRYPGRWQMLRDLLHSV